MPLVARIPRVAAGDDKKMLRCYRLSVCVTPQHFILPMAQTYFASQEKRKCYASQRLKFGLPNLEHIYSRESHDVVE